MFINMGKNYEQNRNGYVYALGTRMELERDNSKPHALYLARVGKNAVAEYGKYEYLAAMKGGRPVVVARVNARDSPRGTFHARDWVGDVPCRHWPLLVPGGSHARARVVGSTWRSLRGAESMGPLEPCG